MPPHDLRDALAVDAVTLLNELIGGRARADPGAAAELGELCSRLPLASRAAAELAAARPKTSLAELVAELKGKDRLDLLDAGGDSCSALRAVFSWSYGQLDADAATAFRLISLCPNADLDRYSTVALIGTRAKRAEHTLRALTRASLVQPAGGGRYRMHDLMRAYAHELAAAHDGSAELRAALTRLRNHYMDPAPPA